MEEISIELHLGAVKSRGSSLRFSLRLNNAGIGSLWIYASDSDGRRSGTLFVMDESEYNELKAMVAKTDQMIQDLRQSGRMREMAS
ncbi:MAG TPA: hypothetical protein VGG72_33865 [Bryobacteraceae bacterium]|jgi:hypothetical protein